MEKTLHFYKNQVSLSLKLVILKSCIIFTTLIIPPPYTA